MAEKRYVTWGETGEEIQLAIWREKLEAAAGSITRVAELMGFTRRHAQRLTSELGLNEYAAELRRRTVGNAIGRPREGKSRPQKKRDS